MTNSLLDLSERCSITLAVVASVHVRTCIGCERKALDRLQPIAAPEVASGFAENTDGQTTAGATETAVTDSVEVINSILKEATCCLYCGERWMRIR